MTSLRRIALRLALLLGYSAIGGCEHKVSSAETLTKEERMDFVSRKLDGMDCEVYFFRSWGGYSHPVRPVKAQTYEESLQNPYCRAWMHVKGEEKQFLLLQCMSVQRTPHTGVLPAGMRGLPHEFFAVEKKESGEFVVGGAISADESVDAPYFLEVRHVANRPPQADVVAVADALSYRYHYAPSGKVSKVEIRNKFGDYKVRQ